MPSPLLVPPPWGLVSPSAVYHYVRDEACLVLLASGDKKLLLDLRKLVGLVVDKKDAKALPRHKQQWQLLQRLEWFDAHNSFKR